MPDTKPGNRFGTTRHSPEKTGEPVQKGAGKGRRVQDRNPKLLGRPQYEGCGANGYNGSVLNADTVFVA